MTHIDLPWRSRLAGAGVIADIAAQSERAGFFGLYIIGPTVSTPRKVLKSSDHAASLVHVSHP